MTTTIGSGRKTPLKNKTPPSPPNTDPEPAAHNIRDTPLIIL